MGKKFLLFVAVALFLPGAAVADSDVIFNSTGGTLIGSDAGLSLSGSTLTGIGGLGGDPINGPNLGSLDFSTGALTGGLLTSGGTFASGGDFSVIGNGNGGVPLGTLFAGTFSQPLTWSMTTLWNGTHQYTLSGLVDGTLIGGASADANVQLSVNTGTGFFNTSAPLAGGIANTTTITVPEPGSFSLLAIAALGLVGAVRHKLRTSAS